MKCVSIENEVKLFLSKENTYSIDYENRIIRIHKTKKDTEVLFYGGVLESWDIRITTNNFSLDPITEFSDKRISGCLNFHDLEFKIVTLKAKNTYCEDAIHLLRTTGNINQVIIDGAAKDGLDSDFSKLSFNQIFIRNSGNDCADFSGGQYQIEELKVFNCEDKGLSVGEKSKILVSSFEAERTHTALGVKDSSVAKFLDGSVKNSIYCLSVYRKKQEYSGARDEIDKEACRNNKVYQQEGSIIDWI